MVSPTYIVFQELAFVPKLMGQMGRVTKVTDVYVIIAKVTDVYVIMAKVTEVYVIMAIVQAT